MSSSEFLSSVLSRSFSYCEVCANVAKKRARNKSSSRLREPCPALYDALAFRVMLGGRIRD